MTKIETDESGNQERSKTGVYVAIVIVLLLLVLLREPLTEWFMPDGRRAVEGVSSENIDEATVEEIRVALGAYEQIRLLLAADVVEGIGFHAAQLTSALRAASEYGPEGAIGSHLRSATASAERLETELALEEARREFALLSRDLEAVMGASAELRDGWFLFSCPMVDGPNHWMQPNDDLENPFMGQAMLSCGSMENWPKAAGSARPAANAGTSEHIHPDGEIAHWTCPMHPSVRQASEGACPICGMDLLPVSKRDVETGVLLVDEAARRRIGVKTAAVEERPVELTVSAVGRTTFDERRLRDVTLKLDGWIEKLYVNETGQPVRRGQTLLSIYSPELYSAQQEYLLALRSRDAARETSAPDRADYLVRAARERLRLWDLSDSQIASIEKSGEPLQRMPILSPVTGFVIEKNVVEGAAVNRGDRLFRVAALDTLWVEADVYEKDLSNVRVGQQALIRFPSVPGAETAGEITWVYPYLDPETRTGRIRIEIENPGLELRPEMFANVEIRVDRGLRTVVPDSAVIRTGPRELVFVDAGDGRLEPREVRLGARGDGVYEVISGVVPGEVVITSANFLISSESRLRSAAEVWEDDRGE